MRTRIALGAAVAACMALSAALASAITTTGRSSMAGAAAHAANQEMRETVPRSLDALTEHPATVPWQLARWQMVLRHLSGSAPPPPAPPPHAAASPAPPAPPPPPPPPPPPAPVMAPVAPSQPALVASYSSTDGLSTTTPDWACIRNHESGDNYAENTGNGYSGAYQFMASTWNEAVSGAGYPQYANGAAYESPPAVQNAAALWLYHREGWSPWSTRYVCGL